MGVSTKSHYFGITKAHMQNKIVDPDPVLPTSVYDNHQTINLANTGAYDPS